LCLSARPAVPSTTPPAWRASRRHDRNFCSAPPNFLCFAALVRASPAMSFVSSSLALAGNSSRAVVIAPLALDAISAGLLAHLEASAPGVPDLALSQVYVVTVRDGTIPAGTRRLQVLEMWGCGLGVVFPARLAVLVPGGAGGEGEGEGWGGGWWWWWRCLTITCPVSHGRGHCARVSWL
jgi:hypothetical protein